MILQNYSDTLPESVKDVVRLIVKLAKPDKLVLFGSRARGDH